MQYYTNHLMVVCITLPSLHFTLFFLNNVLIAIKVNKNIEVTIISKHSYLKVHIWMKNFGQEPHLWWLQGILLGDCKSKLKYTTFKWGLWRSLNPKWKSLKHMTKHKIFLCKEGAYLDKSSPLKYVIIITRKLNIWVSYFLSLHLFVLLE